jgi:heme/copper-type cytochrome/quinol oxidase subunit 4
MSLVGQNHDQVVDVHNDIKIFVFFNSSFKLIGLSFLTVSTDALDDVIDSTFIIQFSFLEVLIHLYTRL